MEDWILEHGFSLFLAVAIPAMLFGFVYVHSENIAFNQEFYVRDIAFTVNSELSIDGEITVAYPIAKKYEVNKDKNQIIITVKDHSKSYPYVASNNFDIELERKGEVLLIKKVKKWV